MSGLLDPAVLWRLYDGAIATECEIRSVDDQWALSVSYRGKSVLRGRYASYGKAAAHAQVLRSNLLANGWQRTEALTPRPDGAVEDGGNPDKLYRVLVERVG